MTTLVWDESGTRYFETGVSRGILWTPALLKASLPGVPWNGLVSIALDPQGGEAEHYYFDGVKYMDRVLAEDFQATIQFIQAPNEFRACEGVREYKPGVMTEMNKRDKFHMAWRTEISSDEGQSVAYKWHIAYNNLAHPAGRAYQTIADTTTMDIRNVVITATPACGRHSYFWFDSREYDLTALEAQLNEGTLPMCYELATLVVPVSGGGGGETADPDAGCENFLVDFENYIHGQTLTAEDYVEGTTKEAFITGVINNGLDIIELPAVGAFAANDSAASEVGTGDILADDDDATYITSADGDLGYTVGLPPLVGYVDGAALELHIRMSISGGVNPDDPDNLDADAQVHISTDAGGDDTVGGFSDGADEGMGFALSTVDGTIVDYVVPLYMDSWVDTTLDDVVTALETGAYLNVVAVSNNNSDPADTPIVVNVYEAKIVMLNDTDPDKFLRPFDSACYVDQFIYDTGTTTLVASSTTTVDFKIKQIPLDVSFDGYQPAITEWGGLLTRDYYLEVSVVGTEAKLELRKFPSDTVLADLVLENNVWYTVETYWGWTDAEIKVWKRDDESKTLLLHETHATTNGDPGCNVRHHPGFAGSSEATFEVDIDNAEMQVHCNEGPVVVELPATDILTAPGSGSSWTDASLSNRDASGAIINSTLIDMAEWFNTSKEYVTIGKYGTGSKKINFDLPAGATVVSVEYVIRAYREASIAVDSGDSTIVAATAEFGSVPATTPWALGKSSVRGDATYASTAMTVTTSWSGVSDVVITDPDPVAAVTNDDPFDMFTSLQQSASSAVVKWDYLGVRITYLP